MPAPNETPRPGFRTTVAAAVEAVVPTPRPKQRAVPVFLARMTANDQEHVIEIPALDNASAAARAHAELQPQVLAIYGIKRGVSVSKAGDGSDLKIKYVR